jgi:hypothetical protein
MSDVGASGPGQVDSQWQAYITRPKCRAIMNHDEGRPDSNVKKLSWEQNPAEVGAQALVALPDAAESPRENL